MVQGWLADAVLALHALFVAWVVAGGVAVWRWPRLAWAHLLESRLRAAAGDVGPSGGFVEHYLGPLIYPTGLTRETQIVLGAGVLLLNVVLYAALAWARWRRRARRSRIA
jgi:hypothetical protein